MKEFRTPLSACLLIVGSCLLIGCTDEPRQPHVQAQDDTPAQAPVGARHRNAVLDDIARLGIEVGLPGVVIAMSDSIGDIHTGAAGLSNIKENVAMLPASQVHAASTTKAITAASTLLLVDRGELSLDALVTDLLPNSITDNVPNTSGISVRQLLLHTSGIYSQNNNLAYLGRYIGAERNENPFWTSIEIVEFAADPENPPEFDPGEGSNYSDINYVLLSMIVSAVSGDSYQDFVQREVFDETGMSDSFFLSSDRDRPRARGYTLDSELLRSIGLDAAMEADANGLIDTTDAQEQSDGAAGIITSLPDLVMFARSLLFGDFLSNESHKLILEVSEGVSVDGESEALGILRAHVKPYGVVVSAEGDGPGTTIIWALHMESGRIVAAAINQFGRWDESDFLFDTVLPAVLDVQVAN